MMGEYLRVCVRFRSKIEMYVNTYFSWVSNTHTTVFTIKSLFLYYFPSVQDQMVTVITLRHLQYNFH